MADMADIADCSGLSWSELATKLDLKSFDYDDVITFNTEPNIGETDSMKLKKEEMTLYGLCPAQDEFFLVICECCHLLIKPQALQYHMDMRHQHYSTSQIHNCAVPLCAIDPITSRNTKCSSHKTNSSISVQSTSSLPGRPCTSNSIKGRPVKVKGRPGMKEATKNYAEKLKPPCATLNTMFPESNISLEVVKMDCDVGNKHHVSVSALDSRITNLFATKSEPALSMSVQSDFCNTKTVTGTIKFEPKNFDAPVVFEPTHIKISEEKEALVKLLESNEWCTVDIKQENGDSDGLDDTINNTCHLSATDQSNCQQARIYDKTGYPSTGISALATVVKTTTLTTATFSTSKSDVTSLVTAGIGPNIASTTMLKGSIASVKSISGLRVQNLTTNTSFSCNAAGIQSSATQSSGIATELTETFVHKTAEEMPENQTSVQPEKKGNLLHSQYISQSLVKTEVRQDLTDSVGCSASNVISTVPLKSIKGRKSPSKLLLCKDREFDPNKHCGVWIEEFHKQCTRSLTCKSHSLSLRRSVPGRCKLFDQLLTEQRERKMLLKDRSAKCITRLKEKPKIFMSKTAEAPALGNHFSMKTTAAAGFNTSSVGIHSSAAVPNLALSSSQMATLGQPLDKLKKPTILPSVTRSIKPTLSSREDTFFMQNSMAVEKKWSEDGEKEESIDAKGSKMDAYGHCTLSHHPHPAAVNGFNSWLHGRGCYVFNRKEDLIHAAFLAAVEKHLHTPPHKKLCLESNLPADISNTPVARDPYEFMFMDSTSSQLQAPLPSPTATSKTKHFNSFTQADHRSNSASSSSVTLKRPDPDLLENKQRMGKTDLLASEERFSKSTEMSALLSAESVVISNSLSASEDAKNSSVHRVVAARMESSTLPNGQLVGIPITEVLPYSSQRRQSSDLRISRPLSQSLTKIPPRAVQALSKMLPTTTKNLPLSTKVVPGYGLAQNTAIKLEIRPATDGTKLMAESSSAALISDDGHHFVSNNCSTVCAKSSSAAAAASTGNSLLKSAASLITTNRIPNIVLTSTLPNGTVKLTQRNALLKCTTNSTSQTNLAAILGLNHVPAGKFSPLCESQAFVSSNISTLGKTNQLVISPPSEMSKQLNHNANASGTFQVNTTLPSAISQTTLRSGFSTASTSISVGSKQYILTSGVRHMYTTPIAGTPKKPLTASHLQIHRPELASSGKSVPSTAAIVAGSKCHLSGQPI